MNRVLLEISETALDANIPSFPGSPRSINLSSNSDKSYDERNEELRQAVNYLHSDNALLEAAELGDDKRLEELLNLKETNIHQKDHLGRSALHLAVCYGNQRSIQLLLAAGICPDVKDNLGMTPLSLCLMRNPTRAVANLLFDHGASILPRVGPIDTGLFIHQTYKGDIGKVACQMRRLEAFSRSRPCSPLHLIAMVIGVGRYKFLEFVAMCTPTYEDERLLELLVKRGAVVNDPEAPGGRQALHIAAMDNNCLLISKLIELGAKTNVKNVRGETPKDFALLFKSKEAYELLDEYDDASSEKTDESWC